MKIAGSVHKIINKHILVVNCDAAQLPAMYIDVANSAGKRAGKLVEIFGNIQSPMAVIYCESTEGFTAGDKLYAE